MASIPAVVALERRFGTRGLRVVSAMRVASDVTDLSTERGEIERVMHEHDMTYACYLDPAGQWQRTVSLDRTPSFLIISRDGRIAHHFRGALEEGSEDYTRLATVIDEQLAQTAPGR